VLGATALPGNPYDGNTLAQMLREAEEVSGVKPRHAYCDLGYRGHDYKGDCDVQIVNRFRKRKPRCVLRWWKRRSAIEPVIGHIKSDHYMERNMLGGERGDKINAVLSAVGFNLVKLMKGLKKRWLKRLFLYLQAAMDRFAARTAWFIQLAAVEIVRPAAILRSLSGRSNWGFA
jgi:IS5 family transposase